MTAREFISRLRGYPLTKQQIKTLRGQALCGDLNGARRGLAAIIRRNMAWRKQPKR
jgi:hypothetical protein